MQTHEIRPLTGLRGVAALYVVCFHYFPLLAYHTPLQRILGHGYLAVDLFFVLSGFVMALNYRHLFAAGLTRQAYATFLGRRIARIYPLYFTATIAGLILVVGGCLPFVPSMPIRVAAIFNLLMVQAWGLTPSFDSPAWSLSAEWAAYLLFPVLLLPTLSPRRPVAIACGAGCIALLTGLCSLPPAILPDYLVRDPLNMNGYWLGLPVLRCVPEFTLGIFAFRFAGTSLGRRMATSRWIAPLLCLVLIFVLSVRKSDLAAVLLLPFVVTCLASEAHVAGRILASRIAMWAGTLSFSIYLTHKLLFGLLGWLDERMSDAGLPHAQVCAAAVCFSLTLMLSATAYRWIEVPGRRLLRDIFERRIPASARIGAPAGTPNEA